MLPNLDKLTSGISDIYRSGIVTNMGPVHQKLESELSRLLGGKEFVIYNNGTSALLGALHAMELPKGSEVITTPFSFAATSHVISAMGLTPVFADIDPQFMTLDPLEVVKKITPKTSAILAVHVYGFACDLIGLQKVAEENDLRLLYDAAHAFGTTVGGRAIAEFGDASVFSFHATKLFNSIEGGAVSINTDDGGRKLRHYRNFGIVDEKTVDGVGLNGKMSEFHALFGLLNLELFREEMTGRRRIREIYEYELSGVEGIEICDYAEKVSPSYQYFVIRIRNARELVYTELKSINVFARRYFYPLISNFKCYQDLPSARNLPNAQRAADEVLCLPFYGGLTEDDARKIAKFIRVTTQNVGKRIPS
jgi:dTDP-4-amino-4,6-dideoxygalactose transaminase